MANNTEIKNVGPSIAGMLGVAFIVLKLTGYINWSWWWVTLPLWGGFAVALFIGMVFFIAMAILSSRD